MSINTNDGAESMWCCTIKVDIENSKGQYIEKDKQEATKDGSESTKYNTEYKVQAVKLSNEIGSSKAAVELGIPVDTLYGWVKAAKEGRLDIGGGAHTLQTAMSLAEELNTLRKQVKQQEKEIRRLKEDNEFLAEASAFFAASRRKSAKGSE